MTGRAYDAGAPGIATPEAGGTSYAQVALGVAMKVMGADDRNVLGRYFHVRKLPRTSQKQLRCKSRKSTCLFGIRAVWAVVQEGFAQHSWGGDDPAAEVASMFGNAAAAGSSGNGGREGS